MAATAANADDPLASGTGKAPPIPDELREYKEFLTAPDLEVPSLSEWDRLIGVRLGAGYDDNILLSHFTPQGSPFIASGLDFSLFRLSETGSQFSLVTTSDDTRYLDSAQINGQDLVTAVAQLKTELSESWRSRVGLEYTYQDQVIDGSAYAGQFIAVPAQGHTVTMRPEITRKLGTNYHADLQWIATRQIFSQPLDSFWQTGPRLTLKRQAAFPTELALSYEVTRVLWDTLTQVDSEGSAIPGTSLATWQHKVGLRALHCFDTAHRWSATTRLGFEYSADNGSTYNDFFAWRAAQELTFQQAPWKINLRAAYDHYRFPWEPAASSATSKRSMNQLDVTLRLERRISKHFKVFGQGEHDQSLGTDPSDHYRMNSISGGIEFEF